MTSKQLAGVFDAFTQAEKTTESATTNQASQGMEQVSRTSASTQTSAPPPAEITPPPSITATIRILFRIP